MVSVFYIQENCMYNQPAPHKWHYNDDISSDTSSVLSSSGDVSHWSIASHDHDGETALELTLLGHIAVDLRAHQHANFSLGINHGAMCNRLAC